MDVMSQATHLNTAGLDVLNQPVHKGQVFAGVPQRGEAEAVDVGLGHLQLLHRHVQARNVPLRAHQLGCNVAVLE